MGESKERRPRGRRKVRFEEVLPSTDLPPLVQGDLRCFLIVDVGKINWSSTATALVPPVSPAYVRLRWWGESSEGTLFKPASTKSGKPIKSRARFGVRSGAKQISAYFVDMGSIILELLTSPRSIPLGHIQIPKVASLTSENPIRGYFPIISPTSRKIGELQMNIRFQTLEGAYDLSTDTGTDTSVSSRSRPPSEIGRRSRSRGSSNGSVKSNSGSRSYIGSARSRSSSTGTREGSRGKKRSLTRTKIRGRSRSTESNASSVSSRKSSQRSKATRQKEHNVPQGVDDLLCMNGRDLYSIDDNFSKKSTTLSLDKTKRNGANERYEKNFQNGGISSEDDAITALLKKGNRLRGDMMETQAETTPTTYEVFQQMRNRESGMQRQQQMDVLNMIKNQTTVTQLPTTYKPAPQLPSTLDLPKALTPVKQHRNDLDMRFVDLVFGSQEFRGHPTYLSNSDSTLGSPMSSLISDFEDNPLFDPALLQQLFYTNGTSAVDMEKVNERLKEMENIKQNEINRNKIQRSVTSQASASNNELVKKLSNSIRGFTEKKLQTLTKVRYVRIHVDTLSLMQQDILSSPSKRRSKKGLGKSSKPPMPSPKGKKRTSTFFVEYRFPFMDNQRREHPSSMATSHDVTRVASRKLLNQGGTLIEFDEENEFAVRFNEVAILTWCNNILEFVVHLKRSTDKKPVPLGIATLPLASVLESEYLTYDGDLEILDDTKYCGNLKISVNFIPNDLAAELSPPTRDVTSQSFAHERSLQEENNIREPQQPCEDTEPMKTTENPTDLHKMAPERQESSIAISPSTSVLHMMLIISDGFDIPGTSVISPVHGTTSHPPNVYLVCRTLASGENQQTPVIWGQSDPKFDLVQISPVKLDNSLLSRMENNFLIIEVWTKITSTNPHSDKLLGLVKLSTHHFHQSLKDEEISRVVLNSQHPLISTDEPVPVIDVFTGQERGKLNVTLALGTQEQIFNLKKIKGDLFERRQHHLEDKNNNQTDQQRATEGPVEHTFEINVVKMNGFKPFSNQVWGETDCFIQYQFPTLRKCDDSDTGGSREQTEHDKNLDLASMQTYRSSATLCVPDPAFNDVRRHIFCPPPSVPVQRILLSCCYGDGFSGGIPFELWSRHYHPNVRDQLFAKGTLPVAKIGSLVTMTTQKVSEQTFNVPLQFVDPEQSTSEPAGTLEIHVRYRISGTTLEGSQPPMQFRKPIILRVGLMRACGLKAAAALACRHSDDDDLKYCADVGVNTYVQIKPTFLPDEEARTSRLVAQSFAPEYQHHIELACPLVSYHRDITPVSLAELIVSGEFEFTVWHRQEKNSQFSTSDNSNDVLLAEVTLPTRNLLRKMTGENQWILLKPPERFRRHDDNSRTVGALEISMTFAHSNDLDLIVRAAKATGWSLPPYESRLLRNDNVIDDITKTEHTTFSITVTNAWLPKHDLLLHGRTNIDKNASVYVRYKFFDHDSVTSSLCPLVAKQPASFEARFENLTSARIAHKKSFVCKRSRPLTWFLREETLEVQVWITHSRVSKKSRPLDSDKLLGSIHVDIGTLGDADKEQHISGSFDLIKPGCDDLGGGKLRVYVSMKPGVISDPVPDPTPEFRSQSESASEVEGRHEMVAPDRSSEPEQQLKENSFLAVVTIERAMHLPLVGDVETNDQVKPNCFVSFEVLQNLPAGGTKEDGRPKISLTTKIVSKSSCPVWIDAKEAELQPALLSGSDGAFLIKVWHRDSMYLADQEPVGGDENENSREINVMASDRMLGFASVDLSVLRAGFRDVNGWYNILDIHGNCQGQLKVAVTPTKLPEPGKSPPRANQQRSGVMNLFGNAPVNIPVQTPSGSLYYPGIPNSAQTVRTTCELEDPKENHFLRRYDDLRNTPGTAERSLQGQRSESHGFFSSYGKSDRQQLCLVTTLKKQMEELEQIKKRFDERKVSGFRENQHEVQTQKNTHTDNVHEVQSRKTSTIVSDGSNVHAVDSRRVTGDDKNNETVLNLRPNWTESFSVLPDMNIASRTYTGDQTRVCAAGSETDVCEPPPFLDMTTFPKSVHLSLYEHSKVNQGREFNERAMSDNEVSSDIEFVQPRSLNGNVEKETDEDMENREFEAVSTLGVTEREQQEQPVISGLTPGRSEGHSALEDTSLWLSESSLRVSDDNSDGNESGDCSRDEDGAKEVEIEEIRDLPNNQDEMEDLANMQNIHDPGIIDAPNGSDCSENEDVESQQDVISSMQEEDDLTGEENINAQDSPKSPDSAGQENRNETREEDNDDVLEEILPDEEYRSSSDTQEEDILPAHHGEHSKNVSPQILEESEDDQLDTEEVIVGKQVECKGQQAKVNDQGAKVNSMTTCKEDKSEEVSVREGEDICDETALHPSGQRVDSRPGRIGNESSAGSGSKDGASYHSLVKHKTNRISVPSFFPPTRNLEASMRALQEATLHHKHKLLKSKQESEELSKPLDSSVSQSSVSADPVQTVQRKVRRIPLKPSSEQTKRLARIFGTKFS